MPTEEPARTVQGSDGGMPDRDIEKVDFVAIAREPSCHFTGPADLRRLPAEDEIARLAYVTFFDGTQTQWHHHTGPSGWCSSRVPGWSQLVQAKILVATMATSFESTQIGRAFPLIARRARIRISVDARKTGLLYNMRQLVRQQGTTHSRPGRVVSRIDHDFRADGVRNRALSASRRGGLVVRVDADITEVVSKPGLHTCAQTRFERIALLVWQLGRNDMPSRRTCGVLPRLA